ncbi:14596_t:CDS:2 [Entrophospora sp. SA101]|nr:14596_t:CDS:2 [Entrophospora sp. SA101]
MAQKILEALTQLLKKDERLVVDGKLAKNKIIELALQLDLRLLKLLKSSPEIKKIFFQEVDDILVFDKIKLQTRQAQAQPKEEPKSMSSEEYLAKLAREKAEKQTQSTITLNPGQMLKSAQELKQSLSQIAPDESKTTKIVTFALVATALGALTGFYDEKIKPTIESKSTEYKTLLQENFARRANTQQAIVPLLNMRKLLKKILAEAEDEIDEMAAVQAFEIFRLSAKFGLIKDPEVWFEFMDIRNSTSHTYDVNILEKIFSLLPRFVQEFDTLIKNLQKLK